MPKRLEASLPGEEGYAIMTNQVIDPVQAVGAQTTNLVIHYFGLPMLLGVILVGALRIAWEVLKAMFRKKPCFEAAIIADAEFLLLSHFQARQFPSLAARQRDFISDPPLTRIMNLRSPRMLVIAAVVFFCAFLPWAVWHIIEQWRYPNGHRQAAYAAAEAYIRKISASGEELVFSGLDFDSEATSFLRHDGDYETTGWVEQKNTHGVTVRRPWLCVVHREGGNRWSLVYIRIDRFTSGTYVSDHG